jgi:hypothetical protein
MDSDSFLTACTRLESGQPSSEKAMASYPQTANCQIATKFVSVCAAPHKTGRRPAVSNSPDNGTDGKPAPARSLTANPFPHVP